MLFASMNPPIVLVPEEDSGEKTHLSDEFSLKLNPLLAQRKIVILCVNSFTDSPRLAEAI